MPVVEGLEQPVLALAPAGWRAGSTSSTRGAASSPRLARWCWTSPTGCCSEGEQGLLGLAFPDDFADSGAAHRQLHRPIRGHQGLRVHRRGPGERAVIIGHGAARRQPQRRDDRLRARRVPVGGDGRRRRGRRRRSATGRMPQSLLGGMLRIDLDGDPYATPPRQPRDSTAGRPRSGRSGCATHGGGRSTETTCGSPTSAREPGRRSTSSSRRRRQGRGLNFGWPVFEGSHCFANDPCDDAGMVIPVAEYSHERGLFDHRRDSSTGGARSPGSTATTSTGTTAAGWIRSVVPRRRGLQRDASGSRRGRSTVSPGSASTLTASCTSRASRGPCTASRRVEPRRRRRPPAASRRADRLPAHGGRSHGRGGLDQPGHRLGVDRSRCRGRPCSVAISARSPAARARTRRWRPPGSGRPVAMVAGVGADAARCRRPRRAWPPRASTPTAIGIDAEGRPPARRRSWWTPAGRTASSSSRGQRETSAPRDRIAAAAVSWGRGGILLQLEVPMGAVAATVRGARESDRAQRRSGPGHPDGDHGQAPACSS